MNKLLKDNAYINDILHQPEAIRASTAAWTGQTFEDLKRLSKRLAEGSLNRIILTGMGASYSALHPLRLELVEHGLQVEMYETAELIHFASRALSPNSLVVAVSQSGQSIEMVQLLEKITPPTPLIGVTNTPDSPLALKSDAVLLTQAGSETTVSCKTYVTALAALAVLGETLTGQEPGEMLSALAVTADAMSAYLAGWESHVAILSRQLKDVRHLMITGRGTSRAAAETGGLIIKESAHFHAEGMSSAAFRHGPFEMVSTDLLVLVFSGLGPARLLNANLVADICKAGGRAELIPGGDNEGPYGLPIVPDRCLPLMEILPIQMVSVALALLKHHKPGQFKLSNKITSVA
jgi:glutamine---fructose-6-phosphate transaminase (isomerizing)